jgi:hypothetical protein
MKAFMLVVLPQVLKWVPLEQKLHLFDGLTEAFTNTTQHAYDKDNSKEFDKWWITASYKQGNFYQLPFQYFPLTVSPFRLQNSCLK